MASDYTWEELNAENARRYPSGRISATNKGSALQTADGRDIMGDPSFYAADQMKKLGLGGISDFDFYMNKLKGMAGAPGPANPYDQAIADQARAQQMSALQLAQSRVGGPSVAGAQAAMAMGGNVNAARVNALSGGGALAGNMVAGQANAANQNLAGQAGAARLQEFLAQQAMLQQGITGVRGADLNTQQGFTDAGLQSRQLATGQQQFGAQLGQRLAQARQQNALEQYKLYKRLELEQAGQNLDTAKTAAGTTATVLDTASRAANSGKK